MNTISACIIVKNAVHNIEGLINDLRLFCDEICINDTGSEDGTLEYLRTQPDIKLIQSEWKGDFSLARTQSFNLATKDWIFWCDADDRLTDNLIDTLRDFKLKYFEVGVTAISLQYLFAVGLWNPKVRLVRNNGNVYWIGKIHEYLWFQGDTVNFIDPDKYGYILHQRDEWHTPRNIDIFINMICNEEVITSRDMCHYLNELWDYSRFEEYFRLYLKYINNLYGEYIELGINRALEKLDRSELIQFKNSLRVENVSKELLDKLNQKIESTDGSEFHDGKLYYWQGNKAVQLDVPNELISQIVSITTQ